MSVAATLSADRVALGVAWVTWGGDSMTLGDSGANAERVWLNTASGVEVTNWSEPRSLGVCAMSDTVGSFLWVIATGVGGSTLGMWREGGAGSVARSVLTLLLKPERLSPSVTESSLSKVLTGDS